MAKRKLSAKHRAAISAGLKRYWVSKKGLSRKSVIRKKAKKRAAKKKKAKRKVKRKPLARGVSKKIRKKALPRSKVGQATQKMREVFERAKVKLAPWDAHYSAHSNRDRTADGEIRVNLPRGVSAHQALLRLEESLPGYRSLPGFWISVGVRFMPTERFEDYEQFMGMVNVGAYYQKYFRKASNFVTAKDKIAKAMQRVARRKPSQIYARLHWNPQNRKPPR